MRPLILSLLLCPAFPAFAQEAKLSPSEELRAAVREWVETKQQIQKEENDWSRDKEVLENYKEGLEKEIADLKQKIEDAKTRKAGEDKATLDQSAQRDRYVSARAGMSAAVRRLEEKLEKQLPFFPPPLLAEPRVAQGIEDLQRDLKLSGDKLQEGVPKRLLNVINLMTEAEKFQQTVHLRSELRKNAEGKEYNLQVIYFGLAFAYAVNEDGNFALAGRPSPGGWKFEERKDLADRIKQLIAATRGDLDAAFFNLPLPGKP